MSALGSLYIKLGEPDGELCGCTCEVGDWAAAYIADLIQYHYEPVGYLYTNLQSGEYHVSDADDDYRGPERALWCIEPVYRRAKGQS